MMSNHIFCFNPDANGGERLNLVTSIFVNGDPDRVYYAQELILNSYCNSARFYLHGATLTPANLRKLADELEAAEKEAKIMYEKNKSQ